MRTLILLVLCAVCATLAVMECPDRRNRRSVLIHAAIGAFIGWLLYRLLAYAGLLTRA